MRNISTLLFLLLTPLLGGCVAALGVGAGVLLSQEVVDNNVYVAHLEEDAERVWAVARSSLTHQSSGPIDVDEDLRTASGDVDGARVTVSVEVYDLDRSILKVHARKYGVNNGEIADLVMARILKQLGA